MFHYPFLGSLFVFLERSAFLICCESLRNVYEMSRDVAPPGALSRSVAFCRDPLRSVAFLFVMLSRTGFPTPFIGRGARIPNWSRMDNDQTKSRLDDWIARTRQHLATRRGEKPLTKAGQLRALWPEIQL